MKLLTTSCITLLIGVHNAYAASEGHGHAAPHGTGAHAEGGGAGLPQFDPSTFSSQVFWLAITFVVLYIFFSRRTLPTITSVIEKRHEHIQNDLETAERLKDEAEKVKTTYEEALSKARDKASGFFTEVEQKIKERKERSEQEFLERSLNEIKNKEASIRNTQEAILAEIDDIAADIAKDAADKIIEGNVSKASAKSAVQDLVKDHKVKKAA